MTVKELIEKLKELPQELVVLRACNIGAMTIDNIEVVEYINSQKVLLT